MRGLVLGPPFYVCVWPPGPFIGLVVPQASHRHPVMHMHGLVEPRSFGGMAAGVGRPAALCLVARARLAARASHVPTYSFWFFLPLVVALSWQCRRAAAPSSAACAVIAVAGTHAGGGRTRQRLSRPAEPTLGMVLAYRVEAFSQWRAPIRIGIRTAVMFLASHPTILSA